MHGPGELWAIVLAAGEGSRVRNLARDDEGLPAPKQYCRFGSDKTLLARAMARAQSIADARRTVVVLAEQHRLWWEKALRHEPQENILPQPQNRGTAAGLLLPLLHILSRDPTAIVAVIPSDHVVDDEPVLREALLAAARIASHPRAPVVLLGMSAESVEGEYGWVLPRAGSRAASRPVLRFVEKPSPTMAVALKTNGALRNSFLLVSSAKALLRLFDKAAPLLVEAFRRTSAHRVPNARRLGRLYATLPMLDFSRDILERVPEELEVLPVADCGWCDLGTPGALARWACLDARSRTPIGRL